MKILLSLLTLILFQSFINCQCSENNKVKTILIGDSWAFFMGVDQTLNNVYENWGHSDIKHYTNIDLSENGAKTIDFLKPDKQQAIVDAFDDYPEVDHVHLSIGGNDFLGNWKVSYTQQETDDLKDEVIDSLLAVIDFIKGVKPDVHIVWSGYVYTNFDEVITNFWSPSNHPFYSTWENMEFPTNEEINEQTVYFLNELEAIFDQDPDVTFINAPGLMQNVFGQNDPLEVAPFGTYQQGDAPLPNGFSDYPSPQNSMRDYGLTKDCFHLSASGYRAMISYQTQKYYHKAFMNDAYFIALNDNSTGAVSSNENISYSLYLGNSNGEDFATLVTFSTENEIDTTVSKARLFLRRKNQTGGNPISDSLIVRIKTNGFGGNLQIESIDFLASADEVGEPCLFGNNSGENWIRLDLPESFLSYITGNDETQIMILAPNTNESLIEFYDASDPEFAPVLDISYGGETLKTNSISDNTNEVKVFPNPVSSVLNISSSIEKIESITVFDLLGNKIKQTRSNNKKSYQVEVDHFKSGTYIVLIETTSGIHRNKFVKQ